MDAASSPIIIVDGGENVLITGAELAFASPKQAPFAVVFWRKPKH